MKDKFKRVMDWGTPRLVTKNRQLVMDQKNMDARSSLLKIANMRTGNIEGLKPKDPQSFEQTSVTSFRKKMMEEERAASMN